MKITRLMTQNRIDPLGLECVHPRFSFLIDGQPGGTQGILQGGDRQSAYQIIAASSKELLTKDGADLWDSGKVASDRNAAISYQGRPLRSRQRVYWKARVWDGEDLASAWSETASFEMGLLEEADWKGCWIGRGEDYAGDLSPAPAFAGEFYLADRDSVASARLYLSGLGICVASVNGCPVTDALFEPGESEYEKRVYYAVYDVTGLLREGNNVLGVLLGNGQYVNYAVDPVMVYADGRLSDKHRYQKNDSSYLRDGICGNLKLLAQLEVERTNQRRQLLLVSDTGWKWADSAVTFQNWYGGEDYDGERARKMKGWDGPEGDRSGWLYAAKMPSPKGRLCAKEFPPVEIWERWSPKSVTSLPGGRWLVDMGKNSAGFVCLRLNDTQGLEGTRIDLFPGEVLCTDGDGVDQASVTQSCDTIYSCCVKDSYVIAGTGTEVWHPRFCYHGFQYVEVAGFPGTPRPENFEGCAVRLMNERHADFETDNEWINQIYRMTDRSIASNMMFSFTDCPQIEKLGWLETTQLMFSSMAALYDVRAWIPKIMNDIRDAQIGEESGKSGQLAGGDDAACAMNAAPEKYPGFPFAAFPNVETEKEGFVPGIAPEYFRIANLYRDPNWGGACVMTPWYYYEEYGDESLLRDNYRAMKAYVLHLWDCSRDGLLENYAQMGEWGELSEKTPVVLVATCSFYLLCVTMGRIASVLAGKAVMEEEPGIGARPRKKETRKGNEDGGGGTGEEAAGRSDTVSGSRTAYDQDRAAYQLMAERIRDAFHRDRTCYRPDGGICGSASQASYGCALYSGILYEGERKAALAGLLDAVKSQGGHFSSGEVGLKYVISSLAAAGENETVFRMIMNPTAPSYRHHVDQGLTTLPEYWNYTELWNGMGRSRNHAMMGHVMEWLVREVLGIRPIEPGYARIRIRPWLNDELRRVRGSVFTVHGTVSVRCECTTRVAGAGAFAEEEVSVLEVTIPAGSVAEVWIPCKQGQKCYVSDTLKGHTAARDAIADDAMANDVTAYDATACDAIAKEIPAGDIRGWGAGMPSQLCEVRDGRYEEGYYRLPQVESGRYLWICAAENRERRTEDRSA